MNTSRTRASKATYRNVIIIFLVTLTIGLVFLATVQSVI